MTVNLNIVEKCVSCLNIKESYDLARRMEQEKTNPVLGYRTAGSLAERKTGEMLLEEMKKAGLTQVDKDKIRVDAWEFKKAVMRCHDREGTCRDIRRILRPMAFRGLILYILERVQLTNIRISM